MLRAGQSLPPKGLSTLRFDAGRFPPTPAACYRASWQLPGPDSHRLADTSLRVNHLNATTSKVITSRAHATGHTKVKLDGLAINQPGSYSFVIDIDQSEVQRLTFRAMPVQQGPIVMGPR